MTSSTSTLEALVDTRLLITASQAGINSVEIPYVLRAAIKNIHAGSTTTADMETLRLTQELTDPAIDMLYDIGTATERTSELKRLLELRQVWTQDDESARTVAWLVASFHPEDTEDARGVGQPMFTALLGVWQILIASYYIDNAGRNADIPLEEMIAKLTLLIQLHRTMTGPEMNDGIVQRVVDAINKFAERTSE